jgi:glycosyltransferase involved in cell wall biosynthesis
MGLSSSKALRQAQGASRSVSGPAGRGTVLAVHPSPDGYGADLQLVQTVGGLVDDGWRVVVALPHPGPLVDRLAAAGAETTFVDYPVLRKASANPLALGRLVLAAAACLPRAVRLVRRVRPSALLVNTVTLPWWLLVGRLTRTPTIGYVHEAETAAGRLVRRGLLAPLLLADVVPVISEAVRTATVTAQPRLAGRIRLVYNGVPSAPDPLAPPQWSEPIRLAVIGRLSPRKAPHVVLEALRRLRPRHDVVLELAGTAFAGYEWYDAELRETAAEPELAGRVQFSGYCSPVWPVLERADIVVAPSVQEPFGNVVVEAQLSGRPVVAAAAFGHLESVTDEQTGLLVPPGDAGAMAEAVERLITDPVLAARLAEQAQAEAQRRFSVSRYRREIASVVGAVARPPAALRDVKPG